MPTAADQITLTFPRTAVGDLSEISADLLTCMHELLERNTDGLLSPIERAELETLVRMAQFSQLLASAMESPHQQ